MDARTTARLQKSRQEVGSLLSGFQMEEVYQGIGRVPVRRDALMRKISQNGTVQDERVIKGFVG